MFLTKEIKERILTKTKNIQSLSQWNDFPLSITTTDFDLSFINYDNILKERDIWENIAKLSVDLWADFEYYGQFTFESKYESKEYKEELENIGCVYNEGRWKSTLRPSDEVLFRNVFMYCLYIYKINDKIRLRECPFCDREIKNYGDDCELCNASNNDMKKQRNVIIKRREDEERLRNKKENDTSKYKTTDILIKEPLINSAEEERDINEKVNVKGMVKCIYCDEDIARGDKKCNVCDMTQEINVMENKTMNLDGPSIKALEEERRRNVKVNVVSDIQKKTLNNPNKWSCGGCEYLNEYTFINCEACGGMIKDGKWSCGECTEENSCKSDHCHNCNNINEKVNDNNYNTYKQKTRGNKVTCKTCGSLKESNDKECEFCLKKNKKDEMKIEKDQWKCGKCGLLQSFDFIECSACGESRGITGVWKCDKCTMINKCDNVRCGACEGENDHLKKEYCEYCKKNKVRVNGDKCRECRENDYNIKVMVDEDKINKKRDIVCENCKLSKDGYMKDCGVCNTLNEDNVKIVKDQWKCSKCGLLQSFDFIECSDCGESRGGSGVWKCDKCSLNNECMNTFCKACEVKYEYLNDKRFKLLKGIPNLLVTKKIIKDKIYGEIKHECAPLVKWRCRYCSKYNKLGFDYCKKCRLFKEHSLTPGDEVKQIEGSKVKKVWICECSAINNVNNEKCMKSMLLKECLKPRYGRKEYYQFV